MSNTAQKEKKGLKIDNFSTNLSPGMKKVLAASTRNFIKGNNEKKLPVKPRV